MRLRRSLCCAFATILCSVSDGPRGPRGEAPDGRRRAQAARRRGQAHARGRRRQARHLRRRQGARARSSPAPARSSSAGSSATSTGWPRAASSTPEPAARALPHAPAQPRVLGVAAAAGRPARGSASPAPSSSTSSIPATACRSSGSGRSASSTATGAAASATTRGPARCSTRRCRWPPSARAGSRGSTCSRSTARTRRGSPRSPRARACRRWRAPRPACKRQADVFPIALRGLGIFQTAPPAGVRVPAGNGAHYLQYSGPAEAVHHQRLRPVARRPLRLRRADGRRDRALAVRRRRPAPRAPRSRRSTPAPGRSTAAARPAASPTSATTSCCATSSPQLCKRTATIQYCSAEQHFTQYLTTPPVVEVLAAHAGGQEVRQAALQALEDLAHQRSRSSAATTVVATINPGRARARDQDDQLDGAEEDRRLHVTVIATDLASNTATASGEVTVKKRP